MREGGCQSMKNWHHMIGLGNLRNKSSKNGGWQWPRVIKIIVDMSCIDKPRFYYKGWAARNVKWYQLTCCSSGRQSLNHPHQRCITPESANQDHQAKRGSAKDQDDIAAIVLRQESWKWDQRPVKTEHQNHKLHNDFEVDSGGIAGGNGVDLPREVCLIPSLAWWVGGASSTELSCHFQSDHTASVQSYFGSKESVLLTRRTINLTWY